MPAILFTAAELITPIVVKMQELSARILRLSDLQQAPLNPGESPDARRHEIAKLGKSLAEVFQEYNFLMEKWAASVGDNHEAPSPTNPPAGGN